MDFEVFIESLLKLFNNGDNAYFVLYAVVTCLLTQVLKKLFVNKVKVDVLHKFDFAVILPFVLGLVFAVADVFWFGGIRYFSCGVAVDIAVTAATVGALATAMFRLFSSVSGKSLNSLLKDDVFGMFYTQLLYYGNVRQQLLDKTITLRDLFAQVKLIAANAEKIYVQDLSEDDKRRKLFELLSGVVDAESISACVNVLNKALINRASQIKSDKKSKRASEGKDE